MHLNTNSIFHICPFISLFVSCFGTQLHHHLMSLVQMLRRHCTIYVTHFPHFRNRIIAFRDKSFEHTKRNSIFMKSAKNFLHTGFPNLVHDQIVQIPLFHCRHHNRLRLTILRKLFGHIIQHTSTVMDSSIIRHTVPTHFVSRFIWLSSEICTHQFQKILLFPCHLLYNPHSVNRLLLQSLRFYCDSKLHLNCDQVCFLKYSQKLL